MPDGSGFFGELKRRHIWRVAVVYAVVAWLLVQLASIVFPAFGTPVWVLKTVIALLVIGFPVALVLAWAYELTPTGIRRTVPADSPSALETRNTRAVGRKLNTILIVVLTLAVILLLGNQFVWHKGMRASTHATQTGALSNPARSPDEVKRNPGTTLPDSAAVAAASGLRNATAASPLSAPAGAIPAKSVAVLPFTNESGDKDQQFFSDGLSEDLINALSQFAGLKVIGRNSAFQFRNSKDSSEVIGKKLGVAYLLEGSVQRAGDEVRITVALINAADGNTSWSQHYDRPYQDLFALQDAITNAVATALKAELLTAPGAVVQSDRPPSGNLDAYIAYQHGIAYNELGTEASVRRSVDAFGEAIRLDPRYAAAYAQLAGTWTRLATQFLGGTAAVQATSKARDAVTTALNLDPESSLAHMARSRLLLFVDMDWLGAEAEARRALQLAPNDAPARIGLAGTLASLGQVRRAVDQTRQALDSDPRHAAWYNWLAFYLNGLGRHDEAGRAIDTAIALQPNSLSYHEQLTIIEVLRGEAATALAAAQKETPGCWQNTAMALALQIGTSPALADGALKKLIARNANGCAYQIAEVYALRREPDNVFQWLDRAWTNRDGGIAFLLFDPFILRYKDDPRFAAFCNKVGLPDTTDAVAMK